ncbi:WAP four-disulfide core domain protein 5-like [Ochotona curzoniae]|uniref:WAP four-disulfide core domain protein 5-like n=1 Tax=Ochotona curzoniae TaxID=130825 RepID=UPI001B347FE2|nr:WAP four-disulfide core domain protein 5-like [Ochotona curzoniae]
MRCLIILALGLLALEAALALTPEFKAPVQAMCPEPTSSEETNCTPNCHNDEDCPGNTMCCPSACGPSCRPPIIVPVTKIGRCPWVQAPLFPHLCIEKDTCNNDNQCSNKKKCCFSRCAMRCMDPVIGESTGPEFRTSFKLGTQGRTPHLDDLPPGEDRHLQSAIWAPDHSPFRAPHAPSKTCSLGQNGDGRSRAAPGGPRFRRPPDDVVGAPRGEPGDRAGAAWRSAAQLPDLASPPDWDGSATRLPGPRCRQSPR